MFKTVNNGVPGYLARITYTDDNGRSWTVTGFGPTEPLAVQQRNKNLAKRLAAGTVKPNKGTCSIEPLIPQWQASYGKRIKPQSKLAQKQTLMKWVAPYITSPVTEITTNILKEHFKVTLPEAVARRAWRHRQQLQGPASAPQLVRERRRPPREEPLTGRASAEGDYEGGRG